MPPIATREFTESGFTVTVSSANSFCLAEMDPYKRLSGRNLKEMDVGLIDTANDCLMMLELKGSEVWEAFDYDKKVAHEHLVENLGSKATDVLLILSAAWAKTGVGVDFASLLPQRGTKYLGDGKLKLCFLVDTPATRASLLGMVKDELSRVLSGRLQLFGIKRITILDFERAKSMKLPVKRV